MKVFLSCDMEGVAGVVSWDQCRPGPGYDLGCSLLLGEVVAAVEGAVAGGATEVLVNDSHGAMANLDPAALPREASYLSGRHKPDYMVQGLDGTFDAALLVGYHGAMGSPSVLSHTYDPRCVGEARLAGVVVGEAGINALAFGHHRVPVALLTGDQVVGPEAAPHLPGVLVVEVKQSLTRTSALSLHPEAARDAVRTGAERAVRGAADVPAPPQVPLQLEVDWLTTDQAQAVLALPGTSLVRPRTVLMEAADGLALYRTFVSSLALARPHPV